MTIEEMRAALEKSQGELRTIHTEAGDAGLNEEQQTRWDAAEAEERELADAIAEQEKRDARDTRVAERRAKWGSVQVTPTESDPFDLTDSRSMPPEQMIRRAHDAFADRSEGGAELVRKIDRLSDADEDGQGAVLARYALVHGSKAYRSAFRESMKASWQGRTPVLSAEEAHALRASMSLTSANGGYALPTLLDPSLIHTGTATKNPIRRLARVEQGTQDKWNGVTVGAVTTAWKAEGSAFTDGSPTTGTVQVDAAMLTGYVTGSYEIFQDSALFGQLPGLIGEAMDYAEGVAHVSGSGSNAPMGIVTAISATVASTVTVTTRGAFTSASAADTIAMYNARAVRYEDSSTWLMNRATWLTIGQQSVGTTGAMLTDIHNDNELLDLPVVRASSLPSATTSGNILAVLGDFKQFVVYDRLGVNVEVVQNVVDGDGIPTGKRGLLAYKRTGSNTSDINAFRFLLA